MAMYWSDAVKFNPIQVKTVLENNPKIESKSVKRKALILANAPIASIIPQKTIAHKMSQIVPNILDIPPAVNKSASDAFSVAMDVLTVIACMIPL